MKQDFLTVTVAVKYGTESWVGTGTWHLGREGYTQEGLVAASFLAITASMGKAFDVRGANRFSIGWNRLNVGGAMCAAFLALEEVHPVESPDRISWEKRPQKTEGSVNGHQQGR